MDPVFIIGVGMTRFGRMPDSDLGGLSSTAVGEALSDAGITANDVEFVVHGNGSAGILSGQEMVRGQIALRDTGLIGKAMVNVENACASSSSGFQVACMAIASGNYDVAVVVGVEKLTHPDKRRTLSAIATATDVREFESLKDRLGAGSSDSLFMEIYAAQAREYMLRTGAQASDFAKVVEKNRFHGSMNPKAQFTTPISEEEVLASRTIADPLTLMMCSPIADGAAALVLCSERYLKRHGSGADSVRVRACAVRTGQLTRESRSAASLASAEAYESAGIGPDDLHVVELHDAAAPAELSLYEEIGLCEAGGGVKLLRSGATRIGGATPVNTSGGLVSRGHPLGATGAAQLVELSLQLRGACGPRQIDSNPRVALAENSGGYLSEGPAVSVVTVLTKD